MGYHELVLNIMGIIEGGSSAGLRAFGGAFLETNVS